MYERQSAKLWWIMQLGVSSCIHSSKRDRVCTYHSYIVVQEGVSFNSFDSAICHKWMYVFIKWSAWVEEQMFLPALEKIRRVSLNGKEYSSIYSCHWYNVKSAWVLWCCINMSFWAESVLPAFHQQRHNKQLQLCFITVYPLPL